MRARRRCEAARAEGPRAIRSFPLVVGGDHLRFAGSIRQAQVEPRRRAHVEGEHLAPEEAVLAVEPGELDEGTRGLDLALGKGEELAGREGEIPATVPDPLGGLDLRRQCRGGGEQGFERAGLLARAGSGEAQHPLGLVGGDRLQFHAARIDQHQPVGLLEHRMGLALDDVDGERVGQLDRHPRIRDPGQRAQLLAQGRDIDLGHGAVALGKGAGIDLLLVEAAGAGDTHVAHLEPRIGGDPRHFGLSQRGHPGEARDHGRDSHPAADDRGEPDAAPLVLCEGEHAHRPVDDAARLPARLAGRDGAALRLGDAADAGGAVTPDLLRHVRPLS